MVLAQIQSLKNMSLRDGPFPNGGWKWYSPQTKWAIPHPLGVTFNSAVDLIIQHRLKNQSITRKHGLSTNWSAVADELELFTLRRLGLAEESPPKYLPQQPRDEPQAVAGGVEGFLADTKRRLKAVGTGIKVYVDVFGESGRPVDEATAEARASICASCPKNTKGSLADFFTEEAAKGILEILAVLRDVNLKTSKDEKLGVCSVCLCPLKSKVQVKLDHILRHTNEEVMAKHREVPGCWVAAGFHNMTATQQNQLK